MSQARGSNSSVIISGPQTVPGTKPATIDGHIFPFENAGLGRKTELNKSNIIRATRSGSKPTRGKRDVSGDLKTELSPLMGRQLLMGFGSVVTTGAGANKTHTFTIGQELPYHTIELGYGDLDKYFQYIGCKCNKLGWEMNPSGILPLSMDFMGVDREIANVSMDALALDLGHDAWDAFELTLQVGGASIDTSSSLSWSLENNLSGDNYCIGGGGKRYSIPEGSTVVSGSIKALFESEALLVQAANGTETAIEATLQRGTGDGTTGNEKLVLTFEELIMQEQDPGIKTAGGILLELPWTAYWNNGVSGSSVKAVLMNTQATL